MVLVRVEKMPVIVIISKATDKELARIAELAPAGEELATDQKLAPGLS